MSHGPNHRPTPKCDNPKPGEKPPVPNSIEERLSNHSADAAEDVSYKVIQCDAATSFPRHEFCEHSGGHGEDKHATNSEEEVGDQLLVESAPLESREGSTRSRV